MKPIFIILTAMHAFFGYRAIRFTLAGKDIIR